MKKSVSGYLKNSNAGKSGLAPVYVLYYHNRQNRKVFPVGYNISPDDWDYKKGLVKSKHPESEEINNEIEKISTRLKQIIKVAKENAVEPNLEYVVKEFENSNKTKNIEDDSSTDFFKQLDIFISEQERLRGFKNVVEYRCLRKRLILFQELFCEPITFESLNLKFYEEFLFFLNNKAPRKDDEKGLVNNTAGKYIKTLKAFVNNRVRKKIINPIDLSDFKRIEEESDSIYIDEIDLYNIYKLDLSYNKEYEEARDLFVVGCCTGFRYSDLSSMGPQNIDNNQGVIKKKTGKTGTTVTIPIIDYVPEILEKYKNNLPVIKQTEFNKNIKIVGEIAGLNQKVEFVRRKGKVVEKKTYFKYEKIVSHTCRRSFCTNMFNSGNPAGELMRISGHSKSTTFMKYIKTSDLEVANNIKKRRENRLEEIEKMAGQKKMNENRE